MNRQASARRAELLSLLATLNADEYGGLAVQAWEVALSLNGGLWEVQQSAATAFIELGLEERALEVVRLTRAQMVERDVSNDVRVDYLQAKALLMLGREGEAQEFIQRVEASEDEGADAMLEELRGIEGP
jgi:hypothetical protein